MKVFLSWSGDASRQIACELRDWLPQVLNKVVAYVSSEDIDKGERWATDIAKELESSSFGVVIVTKENLAASWINFEAGALSKTVDRANVVPFLFGLKRSDVTGPLLQFQSAVYDPIDVEKLVASINRRLAEEDRRPEGQLKTAFAVWWPHLKERLDTLVTTLDQEASHGVDGSEQRRPTALLEEVLDLVRSQQKLLRSPEVLLPSAYLAHIMRRADREGVHGRDSKAAHSFVVALERKIDGFIAAEAAPTVADLMDMRGDLDQLHDLLHDRRPRMIRSHKTLQRRLVPPDSGDS
jgi:hypothetical protein